jgi:hypothetical protein
MSRCTAPVKGHHSASAAANCPVCRYKSRGYSSYSPSYYDRYTSPSGVSISSSVKGNYNISKGRTIKPRWSNLSSQIFYTPAEVKTFTPVREI